MFRWNRERTCYTKQSVLLCSLLSNHILWDFVCSQGFLTKMRERIYERGDFLVTFDLKSGYHHVDIAQNHRKYLGFSWGVGENKKYYLSTSFRFGFCISSIDFHKYHKR